MTLRGFFAALALLGAAACQQPRTQGSAVSQPADAKQASTSEFHFQDPGAKHYFAAEESVMKRDLTARMIDACFPAMKDGQKSLDACVRARFVDAFDDSGKGRAGCARYTNTDDFSECLVSGNTILDIQRRLNDPTPVPANFWSSPDEMIHTFVKLIVVQASESCAANKSDAAAIDCLDGWMIDELDMPKDLLDRCPTNLNSRERQSCFGQAIALRYIRDRIPRIGGVGA